MANRRNHRRDEDRRTETGPRYENPDPGAGCNSTHVARSRAKWKRRRARAERRTDGLSTGKSVGPSKRPAQDGATFAPSTYLCDACAREHGGVWPEGHAATFHTGPCGACRQERAVAHWTDWHWPGDPELDAAAEEGRE